jgi:putative thiamine transport system permease protein
MARTLRRLSPLVGAAPLTLMWALPLLLSLCALLPSLGDAEAFMRLLAHPQLVPALALSLYTGLVSTALALGVALLILAGTGMTRIGRVMAAAGLAIPHLAFAIGFGFLIMPSGLLARLLIGGERPPQWITVQDPWGLSLIAALTIKEVPFLLIAAFGILARKEAAGLLGQQLRAARSLGHGAGSAFLRVLMPQLLAELRWPLLIVFVYGATVVDMALVLGPTQPPTFAVVIWHALNDADPQENRMGLQAALLLTLALGLTIVLLAAGLRGMRNPWRNLLVAGPSALAAPARSGRFLAVLIGGIILLSLLLLLLLSLAQRWPYPALAPPAFGFMAWETIATSPVPLGLSLALAFITAACAIGLAMLWLETQDPTRDRWVIGLALLSLALPQLAIAGGQYRLFLGLGLNASLTGLFLAHLLPVAAYVLIVLQGPWRGFDARYAAVARSLAAPPLRSFIAVKLPLLKAPVMTAFAIGFAVSIVQFVPAQLMAGGRFSTLPIEAVTLSSGGSRALTAAYAVALALPPLLAFAAAALLGRPRWH